MLDRDNKVRGNNPVERPLLGQPLGGLALPTSLTPNPGAALKRDDAYLLAHPSIGGMREFIDNNPKLVDHVQQKAFAVNELRDALSSGEGTGFVHPFESRRIKSQDEVSAIVKSYAARTVTALAYLIAPRLDCALIEPVKSHAKSGIARTSALMRTYYPDPFQRIEAIGILAEIDRSLAMFRCRENELDQNLPNFERKDSFELLMGLEKMQDVTGTSAAKTLKHLRAAPPLVDLSSAVLPRKLAMIDPGKIAAFSQFGRELGDQQLSIVSFVKYILTAEPNLGLKSTFKEFRGEFFESSGIPRVIDDPFLLFSKQVTALFTKQPFDLKAFRGRTQEWLKPLFDEALAGR